MKLHFIGGDHEVTGSCHVLEVNGKYIMLDCGMEQGKDIYVNDDLPVPAAEISAVLLSHAHIDHSGLLPKLVHDGFRGNIWCTEVTMQLCEIMLKDSAHIQEAEAEWADRKAKRSWTKTEGPLYTVRDAEETMQYFRTTGYGETFEPVPGVSVRYEDAGHILGSAIMYLTLEENGEKRTLAFTGDLGNKGIPIVNDPTPRETTDYVITESTYGNRIHEKTGSPVNQLADIMNRTFARGGNVVIPAFAVGRTQEILYFIREILEKDLVEYRDFTVYLDSPLAVEATQIFEQNTFGYYDEEAMRIIRKKGDPLVFPNLKKIIDIETSKKLNDLTTPSVIISAAGMCTSGRIKHHLKHNLWRQECTIAFVGYQAEGTLGREILDGIKDVVIFQEDIHVAAEIAQVKDLSAHADRDGLSHWLTDNPDRPDHVFVVHGDDEVADEYTAFLQGCGYEASAPYSGSIYDLVAGGYVKIAEPQRVIHDEEHHHEQQSAHEPHPDYRALAEKGRQLMRIIEKKKDAKDAELKRFLEDVGRLIDKWQ